MKQRSRRVCNCERGKEKVLKGKWDVLGCGVGSLDKLQVWRKSRLGRLNTSFQDSPDSIVCDAAGA